MTIRRFTNLLETHCFIENELCLEYLSNQIHQRLNESIGMVPNLVEYCNVVKKKLYNVFNGEIKANEDESGQFYIVQFSKEDFTGIKCFFQDINATISIAKTNIKSNCLSGHGGYRIGQSGFRQRDKSFNKLGEKSPSCCRWGMNRLLFSFCKYIKKFFDFKT